MSAPRNDGGPAFPVGSGDMRDPTGMTLRDYMAIHSPAPTEEQIDDYMTGWTDPDHRLARAKLRYLEADAMLKARQS